MKNPFHFRPPSAVGGKAVKESSGKVLAGRNPTLPSRYVGTAPLPVGRAHDRRWIVERAATQHTAICTYDH